MNFEVFVRCGARRKRKWVCALWIDNPRITSISRLAGSFHVLEMGRHYDAYVVQPAMPALLSVSKIPGFPVNNYYKPLGVKNRATGITANIGEAIGAIVARRLLRIGLREVIHITTTTTGHSFKAPDYIFRLHGAVPVFMRDKMFSGLLAVPDWWPVESKARAGSSGSSAVNDAMCQLSAYWWAMSRSHPESVGFGMVVNCLYSRNPPTIDIHVIVPSNAARLRRYFQRLHHLGVKYKSFMKHVAKRPRFVRICLHGF